MDKVMGVQTLNVQVVFSFRNLIGRQNTNWIVANDVKNCYNPCLMAVERLEELLPALAKEFPANHPDQAHLARLRKFNELYGKSADRRRALARYIRKQETSPPQQTDDVLEELFSIACSVFKIDESQGRRPDRKRGRIRCIKAFCHIAYNVLPSEQGITVKKIGEFLGYSDHSTIVHHVQTAPELAEQEMGFALNLLEIENEMRERQMID